MKSRGLTLVELLVALLLMAIVSALAWRGIAAMLRTRDSTEISIERSSTLQTALAQWEQDLAQLQDSNRVVPALEFDGQSLRLTRRHPDAAQGLQVVAWRVADGRWTRWASGPVAGMAALRQAWERGSQPLAQGDSALVLMEGLQDWQLAYYWDNSWANALSSGDAPPQKDAQPPAAGASAAPGQPGQPNQGAGAALPRGVRLQLNFAPASGLNGSLVRELELLSAS